MNKKITFQNMEPSEPLEKHAYAKLKKVEELIKNPENTSPLYLEMWLISNKLHAHHRAEIRLKTPRFTLYSHFENPDMYVAIDTTVDKIVKQLNKEKEKEMDKEQKHENKKLKFKEDKYDF